MPGSAPKLEHEKHSGISQGIGFDAFEIKKFSDTFIIGTEKLGINIWFDWGAMDLLETMATKETSFECETEETF